MTLSAPLLSSLQRCQRLIRIQEPGDVERWRPKALYERELKLAAVALSNGANLEKVTELACVKFLEAAAKPGLDVLGNPYTIAQDFCAIIKTSFLAISRLSLLSLKATPPISLPEGHKWLCRASRDESGVLHDWRVIDRMDEDTLSAELHSWETCDAMAADVPMVLHLIEIGQRRKGHQHTPWCKTYRHPAVMGRFAFQQKDKTPLKGEWKAVWFQDSDKNEPGNWVDMMERDNVSLIHHVNVKQPKMAQILDFRGQVVMEARRIEILPADWRDIPMARGACDNPFTCPWQWKCYV